MDLFQWMLAAGNVGDLSGESLFSAASIGAFVTLTIMEIVLGIDNLVFVAILVDKLPKDKQNFARNLGLGLALVLRLALLFSAAYIMQMKETIVPVGETMKGLLGITEEGFTGFSGKDLILIAGGIFLLYKASKEIFEKLEGEHSVAGVHDEHGGGGGGKASVGSIIFQIILLDLVFSLDSVITAVGMIPPDKIILIIVAMFIAVGTMIAAAGTVGGFVSKHPSVKILALSFLNLIGFMLILEGTHHHVNKGYIYSAMGFSLLVELLNMRFRKKQAAVQLHEPHMPESAGGEKK